MNPYWKTNIEPRNTIVCEMLYAWNARIRSRALRDMADNNESALYWDKDAYNYQATLCVIRRIWKVCRETA